MWSAFRLQMVQVVCTTAPAKRARAQLSRLVQQRTARRQCDGSQTHHSLNAQGNLSTDVRSLVVPRLAPRVYPAYPMSHRVRHGTFHRSRTPDVLARVARRLALPTLLECAWSKLRKLISASGANVCDLDEVPCSLRVVSRTGWELDVPSLQSHWTKSEDSGGELGELGLSSSLSVIVNCLCA